MQTNENGHDGRDEECRTKFRRVTRACLPCRSRKQRCIPLDQESNGDPSCRRCRNLGITCSFATEPELPPNLETSPSGLAQMIVDLERRVSKQEARIAQLEGESIRRLGDSSDAAECTPTGIAASHSDHPEGTHIASLPEGFNEISVPLSRSPFNMDNVGLGPPIATLQSLQALTTAPDQYHASHTPPANAIRPPGVEYDPVSQGILTMREAQQAVDTFFKHCWPMAPFLSTSYSFLELRTKRTKLFLALCAIGSRFENPRNVHSHANVTRHPRLTGITTLLDKLVSQLITQPSAHDLSLDSVAILLLIIQWMPLNTRRLEASDEHLRAGNSSRYSDISDWYCTIMIRHKDLSTDSYTRKVYLGLRCAFCYVAGLWQR